MPLFLSGVFLKTLCGSERLMEFMTIIDYFFSRIKTLPRGIFVLNFAHFALDFADRLAVLPKRCYLETSR